MAGRKLLRWNFVLKDYYYFFKNSLLDILTLFKNFFPSRQVFMFGRMHSGKLCLFHAARFHVLLYFYAYRNCLSLFFSAVDHQWDGEHFATGGAQVDIWNHNRS
jgi:hypothetical protein